MKKYILIIVMGLFIPCIALGNQHMEKFRINGFLSQGFLKSTENNYMNAQTKDGTVEFNEVGIVLNAQITDSLRFGIQGLSKDLGGVGNNEVAIDWAIADYRYADWLGIVAGKIKKSAGLYNTSRDVDAARTVIFLPYSLYNENFRETTLATQGIGFYGNLPYGIEYQLLYGAFNISTDGAVIKRLNESAFSIAYGEVSNPYVKAMPSLYLSWETPLSGLKLAGSYYLYEFETETAGAILPASDIKISGDRYILSLEYTWEELVFSTEYVGGTDEVENDTSGDSLSEVDVEGYYGMLTYRINDLLELGTYYSVWYPNKDKKDNDNYHKDTAFTTRFDLNAHWVFKIEAHAIKGVEAVDADTSNVKDESYLFATKLSYAF